VIQAALTLASIRWPINKRGSKLMSITLANFNRFLITFALLVNQKMNYAHNDSKTSRYTVMCVRTASSQTSKLQIVVNDARDSCARDAGLEIYDE